MPRFYPQETISDALVESELGQDFHVPSPPSEAASASPGRERERDATLALSVERHLTDLFKSFGDGLPPPGLYHRVLRELEYPLLSAALAATRGNQIKAAELLGLNRNTLRKKVRDLDIRLMRLPR